MCVFEYVELLQENKGDASIYRRRKQAEEILRAIPGHSEDKPVVSWRAWQMSQCKKTWPSTAMTQQVTPLTGTLSPWWEVPDGPSDGDRCLSIASHKFHMQLAVDFLLLSEGHWGLSGYRKDSSPQSHFWFWQPHNSNAMTPPHLQGSKWTCAPISMGNVKSHQDCLLEHF